MSNVIGLYTCASAGQPMEAQTQARALAGSGFAGDRYATNQGTFSRNARQIMRHVSLIAREAIEDANRDLVERGLAPFGVHETRRNIITEGVDVNALLGREFRVGDVRMRGTEQPGPAFVRPPWCRRQDLRRRSPLAEGCGLRSFRMASSPLAISSPSNVSLDWSSPDWPTLPVLAQGCPDPAAPHGSAYRGAPAAHNRTGEVIGAAESDP